VHRATGAPSGMEDELSPDGGLAGYTEVALGVVRALVTNRPAVLYLNTANRGTLPFLEDDTVVEVACAVDASGIRPLPTGAWTLHEQGLISLVKDAEQTTIAATEARWPELAVHALSRHPLVPSLAVARTLFERYRAALLELQAHFDRSRVVV
jgi:6-phospho-beta-glucosidase